MTNEIIQGFHDTLKNIREHGIEVSPEQVAAMEILIAFTTDEKFKEKLGDYVYEEVKKALQLIIKLITKLRCDINITGTLIVSYLSVYNKEMTA